MVKHFRAMDTTKCTVENCNKIISCKYNLARHIMFKHQGVRPFECPSCFKRYSSKKNLIEHTKLEHLYSTSTIEGDLPSTSNGFDLSIPYLTKLVKTSMDPDLRPYAKVRNVYWAPDIFRDLTLPKIVGELKKGPLPSILKA